MVSSPRSEHFVVSAARIGDRPDTVGIASANIVFADFGASGLRMRARGWHGYVPLAATAATAEMRRMAGRQAQAEQITKEFHGPSPR